jgi:hypothetical protein
MNVPARSEEALSSWVMSVVREGDQSLLHIKTNDGMVATCKSLTIPVAGYICVAVTVGDNQVRLKNLDGPEPKSLTASANCVVRSGPCGAVLTLEGQARLSVAGRGCTAEVVAERIVFNLMTGHVEAELMLQRPPEVPQVTPCSTSSGCGSTSTRGLTPAIPALPPPPQKLEQQQIFQFYNSFSR